MYTCSFANSHGIYINANAVVSNVFFYCCNFAIEFCSKVAPKQIRKKLGKFNIITRNARVILKTIP